MATKEKSFEELVKEAPEAPAAQHVSLVGALSKSNEPGKFVLTLQHGGSVTVDVSDVKNHTVLGSSVGQTIVRIDVEAAKASQLNPQPLPPGFIDPNPSPWNLGGPDPHRAFAPSLFHTSPYIDLTFAWADQSGTAAWIDPLPGGTGHTDPMPNTAIEGIPDPYGGYGQSQFGAYSPFALATPHQAPQAIVAAMQGLGNLGPQTVFWVDNVYTGIADTITIYTDRTVATSDVIHTNPRIDSGATNPGGPPHTLD